MKNRLSLFQGLTIAVCLIPHVQAAAEQADQSGDSTWPREHYRDGTRLIFYQPQVDQWTNFQNLSWRMAVGITPKGAKKELFGVIDMKGTTIVDNDDKIVTIDHSEITGTHFPSSDAATADKMAQLIKEFVPPSFTMSLHELIASTPKQAPPTGVELKNDPPQIFVAYRPSTLISVDGEPVLADVPQTNLKFVVNSEWPIFFNAENSSYYLLVGERWMTAKKLEGPWSATKELPPQMSKVVQDKEWGSLKKSIPPPAHVSGETPEIFYSDKPAEILLFTGQPVYTKVPQTQLEYATNTDSVVFVYTPTQQFYYLTAGRWFSATDLQGPWTYATPNLPADFSKIPSSSPASAILASVPGTEAAADAVLLAQVPTTLTINPTEAQAKAKVQYSGDPHFEPIQGTSMSYATNTQDKVIKVGDVYYLCLQGVWFLSPGPQGPWTTANAVPKEIYTIPPSSPVYNVTYVTQTTNPDGTVQSSYTAGYLGAFVLGAATGAIIANGSGYYYPPFIGYPIGGYPFFYPWPATYGAACFAAPYYNCVTGGYGWCHTTYGPWGSASHGAAYNPYTGTYMRGGHVSTPYGTRSSAQAYNPYTGTYASTRQGSSTRAQWGSSYVSQGNRSATTAHYSSSRGTVAAGANSSGGKAVASSTRWGNSAAVKTKNGDMYAGHDGNVYRNTGSGWQKYNNGSWNSADKPTPNWSQAENASQRTDTEQRADSAQGGDRLGGSDWASQRQDLDREQQNRFRGGGNDDSFQNFRSSGDDRFGGGGGFGGGDRFGGGGFGGGGWGRWGGGGGFGGRFGGGGFGGGGRFGGGGGFGRRR
jgi:hypothetical protein